MNEIVAADRRRSESEKNTHNRPVVHFRFKWNECLPGFFCAVSRHITFFELRQTIDCIESTMWVTFTAHHRRCHSYYVMDDNSMRFLQFALNPSRLHPANSIRENCIQRNVLFHAINYFIINLPLMIVACSGLEISMAMCTVNGRLAKLFHVDRRRCVRIRKMHSRGAKYAWLGWIDFWQTSSWKLIPRKRK